VNVDRVLPVVIIGAGPAGVSAAWALRARGIAVTILDAGTESPEPPPDGNHLDLRFNDQAQWQWQLGRNYESLVAAGGASPKMRVPGLRPVFEGFARVNSIRPEHGFHVVGALAAGGLSNAWGCGVARFDTTELGPIAADSDAMAAAYARVARRTGLSGAVDDGLRDYFGVDAWASEPLPLDGLHRRLWDARQRLDGSGMTLGRARVAVLNETRGSRQRCDLSGTCLWGCARHATWSALQEVRALMRDPGVHIESGFRARSLRPASGGGWTIHGCDAAGQPATVRAHRVLVAAGTLATTRLVLDALSEPPSSVRLSSNPTAAFLLMLPGMLGSPRERSFGLAQLSFTVQGAPGCAAAMGNLFSTAGLPVSEFLGHLPISRRAGLPLLRGLLPASTVGNVFFPGSLSAHTAGLDPEGGLWIRGGDSPDLAPTLRRVRSQLSAGFRRAGAWMLPGSFVQGAWGSDLHYAATLPIRDRPAAHECHLDGAVAGLDGVYVVDGASLPQLPEKAHTLTIMANADRIATGLRLPET
jgi:choline dehydrogenase-like flavoprotein